TSIESLERDLATLKQVGGPRSVAARALRMLQRAEVDAQAAPKGPDDPHLAATKICARLWANFGNAFLRGSVRHSSDTSLVTLREPTEFHLCVARLVNAGLAIPVSLNFDGFTRKAVEKERRGGRRCVILDEPDQLRSFLCAGPRHELPVRYVIKIW